MLEKKCPCCLEMKPASEYYLVPNRNNSLHTYCNPCKSQKAREKKPAKAGKDISLRHKTSYAENGITEKKCTKCGEVKVLGKFYSSASYKTGYSARCKSCERKNAKVIYHADIEKGRAKNRNRRENNPEMVKATRIAYETANRERLREQRKSYYELHREEMLVKSAEWRIANPEKVAEYNKAKREAYALDSTPAKIQQFKYRSENKESISRQQKLWHDANPEKCKIYANVYRTKITQAGGYYTEEDVARMKIEQSGMCVYCDTSILDYNHHEHIDPVSKGGNSWYWNMALLCQPCNNSKKNKSHEEFLAYREMLGRRTREYAYSIEYGECPLI